MSDAYDNSAAGPFAGKGIFTSNNPLSALQYANQAQWVAVKYGGDDGIGGAHGPSLSDIQKLKDAGLKVVIWQDVATPEGVQAVNQIGAAGYIAQAEGPTQLEAAQQVTDMISVPKALVTNNFMDKYPPGWIAMPEAYQNANPNATVANVIFDAQVRGATIVIPILGTYDAKSEGGGKVPANVYIEGIETTGVNNFGIFSAEASDSGDLHEIFKVDRRPGTPPPKTPPPAVTPPIGAPAEPTAPSPYEHGQGHPNDKKNDQPKPINVTSPPDVQDRRADYLLGLHKGDDFQDYGDIQAIKNLKNGGKVYTLESGAKIQVNPNGDYYRVGKPDHKDPGREARIESIEAPQSIHISTAGTGLDSFGAGNRPMSDQAYEHGQGQPTEPIAQTPDPYVGGAGGAEWASQAGHSVVMHDGSRRTITETGAVIRQKNNGNAYREGWLDPKKIDDYSLKELKTLDKNDLKSGSINPWLEPNPITTNSLSEDRPERQPGLSAAEAEAVPSDTEITAHTASVTPSVPAWHQDDRWAVADSDADKSRVAEAAAGANVLEARLGKNGNTIYRMDNGRYQLVTPSGETRDAGYWDNTAWNQSQYAEETDQYVPPPTQSAASTYDPAMHFETQTVAESPPATAEPEPLPSSGPMDFSDQTASNAAEANRVGEMYGLTPEQINQLTDFLNSGVIY